MDIASFSTSCSPNYLNKTQVLSCWMKAVLEAVLSASNMLPNYECEEMRAWSLAIAGRRLEVASALVPTGGRS